MPENPMQGDGGPMSNWHEYQRLVLAELERLNGKMESIDEKLLHLHTDVQVGKVKSSMWGTLGGALTMVAALFFKWLKDH